jgi:hypothetical protein
MKRIGYYLLGLLWLTYACSNDSASSNANAPLIKQVQSTYGTSTITFDYSYVGTKIKSINILASGVQRELKFEYTADLITKEQSYFDGQVIAQTVYDYDDQNRLAHQKMTEMEEGFIDEAFYTYNNDNTISALYYAESFQSGYDLYRTSKIFLNSDGAVFKVQDWINDTWVTRLEASFSSYLNAFNNITGYAKIRRFDEGLYKYDTYTQYLDDGSLYNTATFQYPLGGPNYPAQSIQTLTNPDGSTSTTTSTYTYL